MVPEIESRSPGVWASAETASQSKPAPRNETIGENGTNTIMTTSNRIALVTGAGSGIGRAASLALQSAGYAVVLAGRRMHELERTAADANASGAKMLAVRTDIRKPDQVRSLFAATKNAFGRLDVLFNNAGISAPGVPMEDLTYEQWNAVVSVN